MRLHGSIFAGVLIASPLVLHAQTELLVNDYFGTKKILSFNGADGAYTGAIAQSSGNLFNNMTQGPDGDLYVTGSSGSIYRYTPTGTYLGQFATAPNSGDQLLGVAIGGANVFVSDRTADDILKFSAVTGAYEGVLVPASNALSSPGGADTLVVGPNGNLYFSGGGDASNGILEYNSVTGAFMGTAATASSVFQFAFGPNGNIYVGNDEIDEYNGSTGAFVATIVPNGDGGISNPRGFAFGPDGNLYASGIGPSAIDEFNASTGAFMDQFTATGAGGFQGNSFDLEFITTLVPEPASAALFNAGLLGILWCRRRSY